MKITLDDIKNEEEKDVSGIDAKEVLPQDLSFAEDSKFQWSKMKEKPLGEKVSYLFTYYGVAFIAVVAGILIVFSVAKSILFHKDYGYSAMLVNAFSIDSAAIGDDFAEYASIDTEHLAVYIDAASTLSRDGMGQEDVSTSTRIAASVQAGDMDAICIDSVNYESYALNEFFADLRTVLPEETLSAYADSIYYMDAEEIRKHNDSDRIAASYMEESPLPTEEEIRASLTYHQSPDKMKEPVPMGIIVKDASVLKRLSAYPVSTPVLGFIANSTKAAENIAFLQYLNDDSVDIEKIRYEY